MAEGVAVAGQRLGGAVHDDPDSPPPPSADAPKGWTWNRGGRYWAPKVRGKTLWSPGSAQEPVDPPRSTREDPVAPEREAQRDPDPPWMRPDSSSKGGKLRPEDVPQKVQDDIAGFAGLIATPILAVVKSADPYCGAALADSFESIFDATMPLMLRSETLVKYFSDEGNDWLVWGKLAVALAPVAKAVVEHHVTRTVRLLENEETGEVVVLRKGQDDPEQLVPPQDFSQFPAAEAA